MSRPSLLDPDFRYTSSVDTDLHKTFRRIRREIAEAKAQTGSDTVRVLTAEQSQQKTDTARVHVITATRRAK